MDILKRLYRACSSMKSGLVLLGSIGLVAAIGSVLSPKEFHQNLLFKALLLLLLFNMTLCSLNQLVKCNRSKKLYDRITFRKVGLLILHMGVVLILLGGTLQSFSGERQKVAIQQGENIKIEWLNSNEETFLLLLDKFSVTYNSDGSPSQYYSSLSLFQAQKKVKQEIISINHPLAYQGSKIYLFDYGYLINVQAQSESGWTNKKTLAEGQTLSFPGTDKTINLLKYIPNYDPNYGMKSKTERPDNPRMMYTVSEGTNTSETKIAFFGERIEIAPEKTIQFKSLQPYAVFSVKYDPGLPFAAAGGAMLMLGACMTLFFVPINRRNVL